MLASSSQAAPPPEFTFVSLPTITDAPPNTHIFWLEPSETHRGYGCHAFHPTGRRILDKQAVPVIYHQGMWYTLRHKAGNAFPHLGAERPDISLYDVQPQERPTTPEPETPEPPKSPSNPPESDLESTQDPEDDSLLRAIRLTPLASPLTVIPRSLPLMATTTATTSVQTAALVTSTSAPAASSSTATQPPPGTSPADIATSLQRVLRRQAPGGGGGGGGSGRGGGGGGGGGPPIPPNLNAPQQPAQQAQDVKMMGALPSIFAGDRMYADDFIDQLKAYIRLNRQVAGMGSYIQRVAFALTLIQGPLVAEWTRTMGEWMDPRQPIDDIPAVWEQFLTEFATQSQDTQRQQHARAELKALRLKWPEIDQYANNFERLTRIARYHLANPETIEFFIEGLPRSVVEDILRPPIPDTYEATKEKAIQSIKSRQVVENIFGPRRSQP